jgi:hypothetical protein
LRCGTGRWTAGEIIDGTKFSSIQGGLLPLSALISSFYGHPTELLLSIRLTSADQPAARKILLLTSRALQH